MTYVYRVEPYAVCAVVYSVPPYVRRGGWTWYTGSAAWMYRLDVEALLGLHKVDDQLYMDPVIPPDWDGFELRYRFGKTFYFIQVRNPQHVASQVEQVSLGGQVLEDGFIPPGR